jgi:hypothetical protein
MFAVAINSSNSGTPIGCLTWMARLLMSVVAGKDLHVRLVIARAASQARPHTRPSKPRAE